MLTLILQFQVEDSWKGIVFISLVVQQEVQHNTHLLTLIILISYQTTSALKAVHALAVRLLSGQSATTRILSCLALLSLSLLTFHHLSFPIFSIPFAVINDASIHRFVAVPYTTAYKALFHNCRTQAGDTVLVHGATGAVGIAAVQLALSAGCQVVGSAGTRDGQELIYDQDQGLGDQKVVAEKDTDGLLSNSIYGEVVDVIDHTDPTHLEKYVSPPATDSTFKGFDVIVEMLANENLGPELKCLAKGGSVAVVGSRGPTDINARDLMVRDASIRGVSLFNATDKDRRDIAQAMYPLLQQGLLKPVVRRTYDLEGVVQAHTDILQKGALGNLVIRIAAEDYPSRKLWKLDEVKTSDHGQDSRS